MTFSTTFPPPRVSKARKAPLVPKVQKGNKGLREQQVRLDPKVSKENLVPLGLKEKPARKAPLVPKVLLELTVQTDRQPPSRLAQ